MVEWCSENDNSLVEWCSENDLELNVKKTKEVIIDFWRKPTEIAPLVINGSEVEIVESFEFHEKTISNDLEWSIHVDIIVKKRTAEALLSQKVKSFPCLPIDVGQVLPSSG